MRAAAITGRRRGQAEAAVRRKENTAHFAVFGKCIKAPRLPGALLSWASFGHKGSWAPYGGLRGGAASPGTAATVCDSLLMAVTALHGGFFDATAADSGG